MLCNQVGTAAWAGAATCFAPFNLQGLIQAPVAQTKRNLVLAWGQSDGSLHVEWSLSENSRMVAAISYGSGSLDRGRGKGREHRP